MVTPERVAVWNVIYGRQIRNLMNEISQDGRIVEINLRAPARKERKPAAPAAESTAPGIAFAEAVPLFLASLTERGLAENTVKAFSHDLNILSDYFQRQTPVQNLLLEDLHFFLHWLEHDRGIRCSKKTLSRRIASAKGFFRWMHQEGHISENPAAALKQVQPESYVPAILDRKEVRSLYRAASDMFWRLEKADERPLLLLSLLLQTGMKKQECLNLRTGNFRVEGDQRFSVTIRAPGGNANYKTRVLALNPSTIPHFQQYCQSNGLGDDPEDRLFACTARNLEYILEHLGRAAGIHSCKVGFEVLRWTCAVNAFRQSMPEEALRQQLGLSKVAWRDTRAKIQALL